MVLENIQGSVGIIQFMSSASNQDQRSEANCQNFKGCLS